MLKLPFYYYCWQIAILIFCRRKCNKSHRMMQCWGEQWESFMISTKPHCCPESALAEIIRARARCWSTMYVIWIRNIAACSTQAHNGAAALQSNATGTATTLQSGKIWHMTLHIIVFDFGLKGPENES